MREILFRGKRVDNGEWIEGSLIQLDENYTCIVPPYPSASSLSVRDLVSVLLKMVDPNTVGQYTGLTDKDGKRVYEGDIVDYDTIDRFAATWNPTAARYDTVDAAGKECFTLGTILSDKKRSCVVIGNIYDNPGLLEG